MSDGAIRCEVIGEARLYLGDCLDVLREIEPGIDAVITDPPYSSGGAFRSDRTMGTATKYVNTDSLATYRKEFSGDNRDQRAFLLWCSIWLSMLLRRATPGASLAVFTDWRQLPTMSDAIQSGGWVWRNLVTWWKRGVRMQRGRFSLSAEYILSASAGEIAEGEKSLQNVLDFAPPHARKTYLYRHFNAAGELLYVGVSLSAVARLSCHSRTSPWYPMIARVTVEPFRSRRAALEAEQVAIRTERPRYNVTYNCNAWEREAPRVPCIGRRVAPDGCTVYRVHIRRKGLPPCSGHFETLQEAIAAKQEYLERNRKQIKRAWPVRRL